MRLKPTVCAVALTFLVSAVPCSFAGNILVNGSFQDGDLTGWTLSGPSGLTVFCHAGFGYSAEDSDHCYAALGSVGKDATITQSFADTKGASYQFSFWYDANGTGPSDFNADWDGTLLLGLTDTNTGGWVEYTFTEPGTGHDSISLGGYDNPSYDALDNVSVQTPEPATLALLGTLLGLAGVVRRRKPHVL